MSFVCRVCLSSELNLLPVENNQLIRIYDKLSDIQFNSDDARPKAVCCSCYQSLVNCCTFSEMVQRSEGILSQLFHNGVLEVTRESIAELNQAITVPDETISSSPITTIKIEAISYDEEEEPKSSTINSTKTIKAETLSDNEESEKEFVDIEISQSTTSESEVTEAVKQESSEKQALNLVEYNCDICGKNFDTTGKLAEHVKRHDLPKKNVCGLTKWDQKDGPFLCAQCNKQFIRKSDMNRHMLTHTGEKPYACSVCDIKFRAKGNLINHIRIHTGEKPYKCKLCDKTFSRKSHVYDHARTHSGEKPHVCTVCNKQFTRRNDLVRHVRIHTGERPFSCYVCESKFSDQSNLAAHIRIHQRIYHSS